MKKKNLASIILICITVFVCSISVCADTVALSGTCGGNVSWSFFENGTLNISGSGDMTNYDNYSDVPWYPLRSEIKSVIIENGVTSIGKYAFYTTKLVNVTIPSSVTTIDYGAFENCDKLLTVEILGNVTLGKRAFMSCDNLNSVKIAGGVIGDEAFSECKNLRTLTLGNNVTSIGREAFYWCEYLTDLTVSDSVTLIEGGAFKRCEHLTNVKLSENLDEIGGEAFRYCSFLKKITIPSKVTTLAADIFKECSSLESVDFKCNISSVSCLFRDCKSLENVTLPKNLIKIGANCFENCTSLESITLPESVISLEQFCFEGCTSLKIINTKNIIDYGTYVFQGCTSLETVLINENITEIPAGLFENSGISTVSLPEKLQKIEANAFFGTKIKTLAIPEKVTSLGNGAFENCVLLTEISIPKKITELSDYLFRGCSALEKVTLHDDITKIGSEVFKNCSSLKNFTFPDNIKYAGYYAFSGTGITEIAIPDSLSTETYVNSATSSNTWKPFGGSNIETVHFGKNRTEIPDYFFADATKLKNVDLSNIKKFGIYSLANCLSITDFEIPYWMEKIPDGLLSGTGIGYVVFPKTVKEIGADAYKNCENLSYIEFSSSVTDIGNCAFYGCTALDAVDIPGTVINIGNSAFEKCSNLAQLIMHKGTQTLGASAFANCNLTQVRPSQTIRELNDGMFYGNPVKILVVPRFCKEWNGWGNFYNDFNPNVSYVPANVELFDIYTYKNATIKGVKGTAGEEKAKNSENVTFETLTNGIEELYFDKKSVDISLNETYDAASLVTVVSESNADPTTGRTEIDGEFISFATDNEKVATVDSTGYVHATGYGTAKITISCDSGIEDVLTVNVVRPSMGIFVSSGYEKLAVGNSVGLTANTIPQNYEEIYIWATSDENVATVTQDGTVTGISPGTAIISVKGKYSNKTVKCVVTVTSENTLPYSIDINGFSVGCNVNVSDSENGGDVIAALYDKNGVLLETAVYPVADKVNVNFNLSPTVDLTGATIKVFWWNTQVVKPISNFRLIEIE